MSDSEEHYRKLEAVYRSAPTNAYYEPLIQIGEGVAEVSIEARPDLFHAAGAVHGSHYFKLLDDAAFFAANSLVPDVFVLTSSFHLHLLRPVDGGRLTARGAVVKRGGLIVAESELVDAAGAVLARGSGTFVRSKIPLDERVGYI